MGFGVRSCRLFRFRRRSRSVRTFENGVDLGLDHLSVFVGSGERVSDKVGLALHVPYVSRIFTNTRELISLASSLGIGLLRQRRN